MTESTISDESSECKPVKMFGTREQHRMRHTRIYGLWTAILRRCRNPNALDYSRYGGRGISVCERWENSFQAFYDDMGEPPAGHQIDRNDNDGPYCSENCRWISAKENARNRRSSLFLEYNGEMVNLSELAEKVGMKTHTIMYRIRKRGMSVEEAVSAPLELGGGGKRKP